MFGQVDFQFSKKKKKEIINRFDLIMLSLSNKTQTLM